jgi:putative endonuclease
MAIHNEIGEKGEALAKAYLEEKGHEILATNYRFKKLEIDIITKYQDQLVVIEVKTRQSAYLAGPEDTVSKTKQQGIIRCANAYIMENEIDLETRFDIISIMLHQRGSKIEHFEDAFYPTL